MKPNYNRIFILGTTGSGKSTLAGKISKIIGLTHYGLDWIVYRDHNTWNVKYSNKIRDKKLKELVEKKKWIIEGAYAEKWILPIVKKADLIIILKLPRHVLVKRIFHRYLKNKFSGKGDGFKDMLNLLKSSYLYKSNSFLIHNDMTKKHKKQCIIINNIKEMNNFFDNLKVRK